MNQKQFDPPPGLDHRFLVTWSFMSGVLQYQDLVVAGSLSTRLLALRSFRTRIIDSLLVMDVFWCFFHIQSQVPGADLGSKPCSWFLALVELISMKLGSEKKKSLFFNSRRNLADTDSEMSLDLPRALEERKLWRRWRWERWGDDPRREVSELCEGQFTSGHLPNGPKVKTHLHSIELSAFIVQDILWVGAVLLQTLWGGTHFEKTTNHPDPVCKYNS